jgi:hypothetical protein
MKPFQISAGLNIVYNNIMKKQVSNTKHILYRVASILLLIFILISCEPFTTTPRQNADSTIVGIPSTNAVSTPTTTASIVPELPPVYQSAYLNPLDKPRTYIEDTCRYLKNRWNPLNAEPGTVVMIILFHDITNSPTGNADSTTLVELKKIMQQLKAQGFEAIPTKKFLAFVERNIKIPPRSVLIMQDGNYDSANFEKYFREYWNAWGWSVVNGWVSQTDTTDTLWDENMTLEIEGFVDHQAHGVNTDTVLSDDSSKAVITRELENSLSSFAEHFGKTPYAFIWPNGGFGLRPVQAARQLGYQLGFTSNARGPIMYNWVPLADEIDPARPTYIPEGPINDPLMTLPRYSPDQALEAIDTVRLSGKEAAAYAAANKAAEVNYYEIVCRAAYGPLPSP